MWLKHSQAGPGVPGAPAAETKLELPPRVTFCYCVHLAAADMPTSEPVPRGVIWSALWPRMCTVQYRM